MEQVESRPSLTLNSNRMKGISRSSLVLAFAVLTLVLPVVCPWAARHDDRCFMYPYGAVVNFLAAMVCVWEARRRSHADRAAWLLLACHMALLGIALGIAGSEASFNFPNPITGTMLVNISGSASCIFCLFSLAAGDPDICRVKRFLDLMMAMMLGVLIFLSVFASGIAGFSNYHLQVSLGIAVFLMLCALAAQQGAESPERERFASIVASYLVARVVMLFLVNIVHVYWLPNAPDMPFNLLFGLAQVVFVVACVRSSWRIRIRHRTSQRMIARTALPTAVLVAAVVLGVCLSTQYRWLCGAFILLCVLCFVLRTQLLYQALFDQQSTLQTQASTLEQWALLDHLTNIGNRRFLEQRAAEVLGATDCKAALLLLDTDYFKEINDTLGHAEGDKLLLSIAGLLKQEIEDTNEGICARLGGDEFAVLLPCTNAEYAVAIAEGLRMSFASLPLYEELHPTVSIGVAVADGPTTLTMLLGNADSALYQSKENGRDRVELARYPKS